MEETLGLLLFQRVRQRLVLTDAGEQYAEAVRAALDQIQEATVTLLAHKGRGGALRIATAPAFATKWLIPRLARFNSAHPGRSEEHTSELQSLMRISYAVFCLKKKKKQ